MADYRKAAGISKPMKDYMDGKISKEEYLNRVKKEGNTLFRSYSDRIDKRSRASSI